MATIDNAIVTTIEARNPAIADKNEYMGSLKWIPIFIDASVALVNDGDTIDFTLALPTGAVAVAAVLDYQDNTDGLGASTTLLFKDSSGTQLATEAVLTSDDLAGRSITVSLGNADVGGKSIVGLVGGADWDDDVDLKGFIIVALNA